VGRLLVVSRAYGFGGVCRENQGQELFESGSGVSGVHLSTVELHLHAISVPAKGPSWGDSIRHGLILPEVV
jgi:hypothetical protein